MIDRPRRVLACLLIALAPAIGVLAAAPARASTTASATAAGTARPAGLAAATALAKATIRKLDAQYLLSRKLSRKVGAAAAISTTAQSRSANWAGYVDAGSNFSYISAQWTEPSITCGSATQETAFWVGFDGYTTSTIEQAGSIAECLAGTAYNFIWYAMYPTSVYVIVGPAFASGDTIVAVVTAGGGTAYRLSATASVLTTLPGIPPFYNVVSSFNNSQTCSNCADGSAEWVAQAPGTSSGGQYPLAPFSPWTVSNAGVANYPITGTDGPVGISSFPDTQVTMAKGSAVLAQPGALNGSGTGFTVTWMQSS
jgi:Peptidase A4 family